MGRIWYEKRTMCDEGKRANLVCCCKPHKRERPPSSNLGCKHEEQMREYNCCYGCLSYSREEKSMDLIHGPSSGCLRPQKQRGREHTQALMLHLDSSADSWSICKGSKQCIFVCVEARTWVWLQGIPGSCNSWLASVCTSTSHPSTAHTEERKNSMVWK